MPQMLDPNFARTVVLLAEYGKHGAFGLVVNRQMAEPAHEVIKADPPLDIRKDVYLYVGGPGRAESRVGADAPSRARWRRARDHGRGVFVGGARVIRHALSSSPDPQVRLVVGYAGWAPGQLDEELAASSWLMAPVQPDLLFDIPIDAMWETAIRRLGAEPSALQTSSGVH